MVKVGIDIVEIKRFKKLLDKTSFVSKVFDESELDNSAENLVAIFALKEAFFKASQIKIRNWNEIIIKLNEDKIEIAYDKDLIDLEIRRIESSIEFKDNHAIGKVIINSKG